jgi:hypothetical protein
MLGGELFADAEQFSSRLKRDIEEKRKLLRTLGYPN